MRSIAAIAPIILAAGDSTRMGHPKALLPIGDDLFITRIIKTVVSIGFPPPTIVLGRSAELIRARIGNLAGEFLVNPDPDRGQLSSIQLAFSSLDPRFHAGMIWPVDQPAISEVLVQKLIDLFLNSRARVGYPKCGERRGHPAIFHRALFQEFLEIPVGTGPRPILDRHRAETLEVLTDEKAVIQDIDTPQEYEALTGETLEQALSRTKH